MFWFGEWRVFDWKYFWWCWLCHLTTPSVGRYCLVDCWIVMQSPVRNFDSSTRHFCAIGCLSGRVTSVLSFKIAGELSYQTNFIVLDPFCTNACWLSVPARNGFDLHFIFCSQRSRPFQWPFMLTMSPLYRCHIRVCRCCMFSSILYCFLDWTGEKTVEKTKLLFMPIILSSNIALSLEERVCLVVERYLSRPWKAKGFRQSIHC